MDDGSDNGSISGSSDSSSSGSAVVTAVEATANGNDRGSSSSISTEGASSTLYYMMNSHYEVRAMQNRLGRSITVSLLETRDKALPVPEFSWDQPLQWLSEASRLSCGGMIGEWRDKYRLAMKQSILASNVGVLKQVSLQSTILLFIMGPLSVVCGIWVITQLVGINNGERLYNVDYNDIN